MRRTAYGSRPEKNIPLLRGLVSAMVALGLLAPGCATVISKQVREKVNKEVTFSRVKEDPEAYQGEVVMWAGVIIRSENREEGTLIEILQKATDWEGAPEKTDRSGGRFLALYDGYLETAVFNEGREVTVAGEVAGKRALPLGQIDYVYPLISILEIHLWPERSYGDDWPSSYWYDPWFWGPPHHRHYW